MATYAIGDIQGCFASFVDLLSAFRFDPKVDQLWVAGDLVNRGQHSLAVLRYIYELGERAQVVLGNHDLHLIAAHRGIVPALPGDTFDDVLKAPDADELLSWLSAQPFAVAQGEHLMVHAGLLPKWNWADAMKMSQALSKAINGSHASDLLCPQTPKNKSTAAIPLLRRGLAGLTRVRMLDASGRMRDDFKKSPQDAPKNWRPWYDAEKRRFDSGTVIFGHWAALGHVRGAHYVGLDSGCVWGGSLTALCLDNHQIIQVPANRRDHDLHWTSIAYF